MERLLLKAPEQSKFQRLPPRFDTWSEARESPLRVIPYYQANVPLLDGVITAETLDDCMHRTEWTRTEFDRYRVLGEIEPGGVGQTFRAYDQTNGEIVCIKQLLPKHETDDYTLDAFMREGILLTQLNHPNITRGKNFFVDNGNMYIVMELFPAPSLKKLISQRKKENPYSIPMTLNEADTVLQQLAAAHTYMDSRGIVHRDTKPQNLLFDGEVLKVVDLGGANAVHDLSNDLFFGTAAYRKPGSPNTQAVEAHSVGAVLYEMLTGNELYERKTIMETIHTHDLKRNLGVNLLVLETRLNRMQVSCDLSKHIITVIQKSADYGYPDVQALVDDYRNKNTVPQPVEFVLA